jgi:endonuclease/exonuclease/phosphatase family metal-dependent hydrolase
MTQNMDEGTDYQSLSEATDGPSFLAAVTQTYQEIVATDPAARAGAMAEEIASQQPALIGLQEASAVHNGPSSPAMTVTSDLLQSLLDDLASLSLHYEAVVVSPRLDAEAPSTLGFDVRLTTRDVILARTDLPGFSVSNPQSQTFDAQLAIPTPIGTISLNRGWSSVDADYYGRTFRFIDTHLDTEIAPAVQLAQAEELVGKADQSHLPAVYVGDFNTSANDPTDPTFLTYETLLNAGLTDAWTTANPDDPGNTCCQAPELMNVLSQLDHRGDLIMTAGNFSTINASLVGNEPTDRIPLSLGYAIWPSDHAGVVATLDAAGLRPTS